MTREGGEGKRREGVEKVIKGINFWCLMMRERDDFLTDDD